MKLTTTQLGDAPIKQIVIIGALALVVAGGFFLLDQGKVEAKFTSAPTILQPGSSYHYVYTVSRAKFGKESPLPDRSYSFRIEPGEDKVNLSPSTGTSDETGQIDLTVTPQADFNGPVSIWVKDNLTGLEHAEAHIVVRRNT